MTRNAFSVLVILCGLLAITGCGQNPIFPPKAKPAVEAPKIPPEDIYFERHNVLDRVKESQLIARGTIVDTTRTVEIQRFGDDPVPSTYRLFTLKVEEVYLGEPMKEAQVLVSAMSFYERPYVPEPHMAKLPPTRPWTDSIQVIDGQEGVFFLMTEGREKNTFILSAYPLNPLNTLFNEEIESIRQILKEPRER